MTNSSYNFSIERTSSTYSTYSIIRLYKLRIRLLNRVSRLLVAYLPTIRAIHARCRGYYRRGNTAVAYDAMMLELQPQLEAIVELRVCPTPGRAGPRLAVRRDCGRPAAV